MRLKGTASYPERLCVMLDKTALHSCDDTFLTQFCVVGWCWPAASSHPLAHWQKALWAEVKTPLSSTGAWGGCSQPTAVPLHCSPPHTSCSDSGPCMGCGGDTRSAMGSPQAVGDTLWYLEPLPICFAYFFSLQCLCFLRRFHRGTIAFAEPWGTIWNHPESAVGHRAPRPLLTELVPAGLAAGTCVGTPNA